MTTAQRQAAFQARNPGYDRRRKARQRASQNAAWEAYVAGLCAQAAIEQAAAAPQPLALHAETVDSDGQFLLFPAMRAAA
jgi:hypothetical protein